jgi:hypothetical protein
MINSKIVVLATVGLLSSLLPFITKQENVLAQVTQVRAGHFQFNKTINTLWVGIVTVSYDPAAIWYPSSTCGGQDACLAVMPHPKYGITKVSIPVHTGKCPNQNHIKHTVTAHFKGGNNGEYWFKTSQTIEGSDKENKDMTIFLSANGFFGEPSQGNLSLEVRSECVYHGVRGSGGGGRRWDPRNW